MGIKDKIVSEAKEFGKNDLLGAEGWRESKVGWAFGRDTFRNAAKSAKDTFTSAKANVTSLTRIVFRKETAEPLPTTSADPAERFRVAMAHYNRDDAYVLASHAGTYRGFLLYAALLVACIAFGIASFAMYETAMPPVIDFLSRFLPIPALFALTMRWAFYNWQFRTRRLGGFKEWLSTPEQWWPMPPHGDDVGGTPTSASRLPKAAALGVGLLAVAGAAALLAEPAFAQAGAAVPPQAFQMPAEGDLWRELLEQVFPGLAGLGGQPNIIHNGIAGAFGSFLAILLGIASGTLSLHVILGMVNTAHEGKVLGQRWHQIWAPIRVSVGVGMLTPVVKGYCVAQILAIQIAIWGGSLGNVVWGGLVDNLTIGSMTAPRLQDTLPLGRDLAFIEICHATMTDLHSKAPSPDTIVPPYPTAAKVQSLGGYQLHRWDYGLCGKIEGKFYLVGNDARRQNYERARLRAFNEFRAKAKELAPHFAQGTAPGGTMAITLESASERFNQYMAAKDAYDTAVMAAVQTYANGAADNPMEEFKEEAKRAGWISAGSYYMTLSRMQNSLYAVARNTPSVSLGFDPNQVNEAVAKRLNDQNYGALTVFATYWDKFVESSATLSSAVAKAGKPEEGTLDSILNALFNWPKVVEFFVRVMENEADASKGETAMQGMIDFGHFILDIFWTALGLMLLSTLMAKYLKGPLGAIGGAALKYVGIGEGALSLPTPLIMFGMFLLMGLAAVGVVHAYLLPMIPYIQFFFFTMGMLILTAEAVIAAPLWAFFHIRMDGQDFVDQVQKPGYMILFNLLLRIPLALFGLFFSIIIFEAMVWLLNITFFPAVASAIAANWSGLIGGIVMMMMLSYLHYQVAIRSFNLITQVPDRVSRWFGQGGEQLGEEHEAKQSTAFVVGQVNSGIQSVAGKGMMAKGMSQPTQNNDTSKLNQAAAQAGTNAQEALQPSSTNNPSTPQPPAAPPTPSTTPVKPKDEV